MIVNNSVYDVWAHPLHQLSETNKSNLLILKLLYIVVIKNSTLLIPKIMSKKDRRKEEIEREETNVIIPGKWVMCLRKQEIFIWDHKNQCYVA